MAELNDNLIIDLNKSLSDLASKIEVMANSVNTLATRVEEVAEDVSKIKEAVYNPDSGLYARLAAQDARLTVLEEWRKTSSRVNWVIFSVIAGLVVNQIWTTMFPS